MTEGERAGRWAMLYIYTVLFALWFNIVCIAGWFIKEWFL